MATKALKGIGLLAVLAGAFAGGYVYKAVKGTPAASAAKGGRKVLYWVDPMHPAYKSDKPGIAPDCGMKLEPVYADGGAPTPSTAERADDPSTMPPGTVQITPEKQQLIGVKYGKAEMSGGSRTIRAVGKVAIDETRIEHVHTKVEGWIDQVFVAFTGKLVKKGDPLLTIYSPDLLASQRELLLAAKAKNLMRNSALPAAFDQSESLLQASRRRLELWDLSETQINQVLQTGEPIKNITVYSPATGYITDRKAFPQLKIMPDTDLYTIVDLSHVWIMADVFEYEAPNIRIGGVARVSLEALPGKTFNARIDYLQPQVDPVTRTLKVRLNMDNPGLMLKPDMYADVEFSEHRASTLTVPAEAVLDAGERKTVFIDRGNGYFEPRQVTTGDRDGDRVQILSGLSGGERIVVSGNFLIDSESQMKAAAAGMGGMAGMPGMTTKPANSEGAGEAMIDAIIEFSAKNKIIVFILIAVAIMGGLYSMRTVPLDALPDMSDTQVIVYSRWDRSPDIMEDQVTYPLVTAMLGAPKVKDVRGFSDFGFSYVYIIFEEGTDIYWARSRTLEYLSNVLPRLPQGVKTELGPDATGIGWVFEYALIDTTGKQSLADLRSYQDWYLRYYLKSVPGVAEVAPLGGFVRQYQVNVDPNKLQSFNIPISKVVDAVRAGNNDVGGRLVEFTGAEYMVRGRGYAQSTGDLGKIVLAKSANGIPILVSDAGQVTLGPDIRRGVADWNGTGETVAGIVIMRQGENALQVIERVKQKLHDIEGGLPAGVKVVTAYDRSELILRSIENLKHTLTEELIIVAIVIMIFLWHIPSAIIPIITVPVAVIISFIPIKMMGLTSNIMSLGGIAIAVGAMVDAAIVVVEQTHKKLEEWERTGRKEDYHRVVIDAVKEVGGPSFFALLVIAVAFLPVLTLEAQEGRLFKPLAYTKTFSMIIAAVLAITLDPAMRLLFTHMKNYEFRPRWLARAANAILVGKIHSEENHPISKILIRLYAPVCAWALRWKWLVIAAALALVIVTVPVFQRLGSEFMPPLDEGSLLYMPSTLPGISVTQAQALMQVQDRIIKQFPEVSTVLGKAGRAETSTDPAPLSMMETIIVLKPETEWRNVDTWYTSWAPKWAAGVFRRFTPDRISTDQLVEEMNQALKIPGTSNAWTMPIKARVDMLTTGVRTPVGIKIYGADIRKIEDLGTRIEALLPKVQGTRSVFSERTSGGYFLDFKWNRDQLARYGLSMDNANDAVMSAIGGENVTTTVEGRERYPVNVRYMRDYRSDTGKLGRVLVPTMDGQAQVPLAQLAEIRTVSGPAMLRDENGMLNGYVYVDVAGRDIGSYVEEAKRVVAGQVKLPAGYALAWSGQYEAMQRVREKLIIVLPLTVFLIVILLFVNTKSMTKTLIIIMAVPFSAVGAVWFLYLLGYNMSIGVWVGLIALMGVDAETAVFMMLYLDIAHDQAKAEGRLRSLSDLQEAIMHGAVKRIRPKFMTVATMFMGLVPIMWSVGTGADVMKRIAAPMIGGIFTSFVLELVVYPAVYEIWKWNFELKRELSRS